MLRNAMNALARWLAGLMRCGAIIFGLRRLPILDPNTHTHPFARSGLLDLYIPFLLAIVQ